MLHSGGKYVVEFVDFQNEEGQAESEVVERERLRLVPTTESHTS